MSLLIAQCFILSSCVVYLFFWPEILLRRSDFSLILFCHLSCIVILPFLTNNPMPLSYFSISFCNDNWKVYLVITGVAVFICLKCYFYCHLLQCNDPNLDSTLWWTVWKAILEWKRKAHKQAVSQWGNMEVWVPLEQGFPEETRAVMGMFSILLPCTTTNSRTILNNTVH